MGTEKGDTILPGEKGARLGEASWRAQPHYTECGLVSERLCGGKGVKDK